MLQGGGVGSSGRPQAMSFCPVPHTARDQVWLAVGTIAGVGVAYCALPRRGAAGPSGATAKALASPNREVCVSKWKGGDMYEATVGKENHKVVIQPGPGGQHAAPMQVLLPAAAACTGVGVVAKLQKAKVDVQSFEIHMSAVREVLPGRPTSCFSQVDMTFVVKAPGADFDQVNKICVDHQCGVVGNLSGVSTFTKTTVLN